MVVPILQMMELRLSKVYHFIQIIVIGLTPEPL